jgi:hypothetical protein
MDFLICAKLHKKGVFCPENFTSFYREKRMNENLSKLHALYSYYRAIDCWFMADMLAGLITREFDRSEQ